MACIEELRSVQKNRKHKEDSMLTCIFFSCDWLALYSYNLRSKERKCYGSPKVRLHYRSQEYSKE